MYSERAESLDGLELICTSKHGIVHYVIFRGEFWVIIVKPTTPSLALCKYIVYIYMYFVSHYALQVQQFHTLINIEAIISILISFHGFEFTV
jgi:hypothetical protein